MRHLEGSVADKHIDRAELAHRPIDNRAAVARIRQISGDQHADTARIAHQLGHLLGVLMLVEVGDQHVGAFAGERDRDSTPDPAVCR